VKPAHTRVSPRRTWRRHGSVVLVVVNLPRTGIRCLLLGLLVGLLVLLGLFGSLVGSLLGVTLRIGLVAVGDDRAVSVADLVIATAGLVLDPVRNRRVAGGRLRRVLRLKAVRRTHRQGGVPRADLLGRRCALGSGALPDDHCRRDPPVRVAAVDEDADARAVEPDGLARGVVDDRDEADTDLAVGLRERLDVRLAVDADIAGVDEVARHTLESHVLGIVLADSLDLCRHRTSGCFGHIGRAVQYLHGTRVDLLLLLGLGELLDVFPTVRPVRTEVGLVGVDVVDVHLSCVPGLFGRVQQLGERLEHLDALVGRVQNQHGRCTGVSGGVDTRHLRGVDGRQEGTGTILVPELRRSAVLRVATDLTGARLEGGDGGVNSRLILGVDPPGRLDFRDLVVSGAAVFVPLEIFHDRLERVQVARGALVAELLVRGVRVGAAQAVDNGLVGQVDGRDSDGVTVVSLRTPSDEGTASREGHSTEHQKNDGEAEGFDASHDAPPLGVSASCRSWACASWGPTGWRARRALRTPVRR
jgi:hypothetical protein